MCRLREHMPLTKTQKAPSMAAHHGPSMARDALLKAYAPIASGFVSSLKGRENRPFYLFLALNRRENYLLKSTLSLSCK